MRNLIGTTLVLMALSGCATKPLPSSDLQLVGTEPFWGGLLTRDSLTITGLDRPTIVVRNPGFPCVEGAAACFFGEIDGARYVNANMADGRRFSLIADPQPCSDGMSDRRYPYRVSIGFSGVANGADKERLEGAPARRACSEAIL